MTVTSTLSKLNNDNSSALQYNLGTAARLWGEAYSIVYIVQQFTLTTIIAIIHKEFVRNARRSYHYDIRYD